MEVFLRREVVCVCVALGGLLKGKLFYAKGSADAVEGVFFVRWTEVCCCGTFLMRRDEARVAGGASFLGERLCGGFVEKGCVTDVVRRPFYDRRLWGTWVFP